jgi:two-component system, NtrC family, response regulator
MMINIKPKLLVIEDDPGLQAQLKWAYEDFEVVLAGDRAQAMAALRAEEPAVVTLDLGLPPDPDGTSEGFAVLDEIMAIKPDTKVIVASGHGARESALQAIARGAYDFYQKPVDIDAIGLIVRRALSLHRIEAENRQLAAKATGDRVLGRLITAAPEMVRVARTIERVANTNVSVMLLGASGTGSMKPATGRAAPSLQSTARRSRKICSRASFSAMRRAHLPARSRPPRARSSRLAAAPCFSMRWAISRCNCRSSCCASCRSG